MKKKTMKAAALAVALGTVFQFASCITAALTLVVPDLLLEFVLDNNDLIDIFPDGVVL